MDLVAAKTWPATRSTAHVNPYGRTADAGRGREMDHGLVGVLSLAPSTAAGYAAAVAMSAVS
jgi:hypothetical protein